jgi:hypothetical protein
MSCLPAKENQSKEAFLKNMKQRQSQERTFSARARNATDSRSFRSQQSSDSTPRFIHSVLKIDASLKIDSLQFRTYSDPVKTPTTLPVSDDVSVMSHQEHYHLVTQCSDDNLSNTS